jgi:Lhr-like helicase
MELFSPAARDWFVQSFGTPTDVQRKGWPPIAEGKHTLLIAPTGSGKTLAAFLAGIDAVGRLPDTAEQGVRLLYVSPLKALVYDIERNLRAPLVGVARAAARLGQHWRDLQVDVRTGDTPQKTRRQQMRQPAEILVTTPESLFLILGSQAREGLRTVHTLIVDEVHALAGEKRGVHLALSLERLCDLTGSDPQRIGLSATVRPSDEVARFLGGERPVTAIDASTPPHLDLAVVVPVPDMESIPVEPPKPGGGPILGALYAQDAASERRERGIWSALYPALLDEVRAHRSTLIFVNSRGLCERLARRLNELAGEEWVQAHHGSVSHAKRTAIEEALKRGHLRGIVATSSLELGIDMGAVDRVLLVESPGSVARGLQRVGRAGHRVGEVSAGRIYPKFRGDLLECAVVASRMQQGEIESLRVPHNALDVLAQQIVALCCERPRAVDEIMPLVHRTYAYRGLSQDALHAVLDMLCGQFVSTEFADLRPLLRWDRTSDMLSARRAAPMISRMNGGTIPDRGSYGVYLGPEGSRVGELDEEMVFETRTGDTILLGASSWRVEQITRDRVIVSPAPGEPGRLPFWRGDGPGRPFELGQALGALVRTLGAMPQQEALKYLLAHVPLEHFAAQNLVAYIAEQKAHTELRCAGDPTTWLHRLQHERRAVEVAVAGELRWIAAQDAGLYRDALGVVPPPGLPQDCLRVPDEPLEQLAQRYAQTHGPFLAQEPAARWGLLPAQLEPVLRVLEERGIVVRGELYPGRDQLDWCHVEVLRRLKRHTLARLRHQVAAVDARALGRFLPMWQGLIARVPGQDRLLEVITQLEGLALPWSTLSTVMLPARVAGFALDTLDMVAATGAVVWVGFGPLGARDGRVALYRRTEVGRLLAPAEQYVPPSEIQGHILEHLKTRGASFLTEIEAAVQRLSPSLKRQEFETALWDLVWAGQITNDTFTPLRSLGRSRPVTGRPHRRASHVLAGGRWSLVADLMDTSVTETERTLARARMLLERYGLVSREVVAFEEVPGGFAPILKVLKAMEASGRVRRGYFVEGLSGAQFGHPGAVERLRAAANDIDAEAGRGEPPALVLAAVDPANPYGALLPWPKTGAPDGLRPRRVPGAWVVLLAGACALYVGPGGRQLLTFPDLLGPDDERCSAAFQALRRLPQAGRRLLVVERVDGVPVRDTPHYPLLKACGFEPDYRGLVAGAER